MSVVSVVCMLGTTVISDFEVMSPLRTMLPALRMAGLWDEIYRRGRPCTLDHRILVNIFSKVQFSK
jgi:hypothetical protein